MKSAEFSRLLVLFLCFCEQFYETKTTSILIPFSLASLNTVFPRFPVHAKKNPSTACRVFGDRFPGTMSYIRNTLKNSRSKKGLQVTLNSRLKFGAYSVLLQMARLECC